jgi:hypothetical protein
LLLGYKPVQHVTVLNTVGNCNTVVSVIILCYNVVLYYNFMILWDQRRICGPSLTETPLCDAYLYSWKESRRLMYITAFCVKTLSVCPVGHHQCFGEIPCSRSNCVNMKTEAVLSFKTSVTTCQVPHRQNHRKLTLNVAAGRTCDLT